MASTSNSRPSQPPAIADAHADAATGLSSIDLHILSPSPEVKHGRLALTEIPLDTSIASLKLQIQALLDSRPPSDRQRLIYRGRPLRKDQDTLREILKSEMETSATPRSYTIHLVLTPPDSSVGSQAPNINRTVPNTSTMAGAPASVQGAASYSSQAQAPVLARPVTQTMMTHHHHAQGHLAHAEIRNQLRFLQQQLQQEFGIARPTFLTPEDFRRAHLQGMAYREQLRQHRTGIANQGPTAATGITNQEPTVALNSPSTLHAPAQVGDAPESSTNAPQGSNGISFTQDTLGPNGMRVRVTVNQSMTVSHSRNISRGSEVLAPFSNQSSNRASPPVQPGQGLTSPPQQAVNHHTRSIPEQGQNFTLPTMSNQVLQSTLARSLPTSPTVYLLSSPNGPEAILVASQATYTAGLRSVNGSAFMVHRQQQIHEGSHHSPTPGMGPPPGVPADQQPRPPADAEAHNPAQAQARNPERDFALSIMRRFWLFLRLYIFAFLFSEAGTWRRWILLSLGALIAALSETATVQRVRRVVWDPFFHHLEGLVPLAGNEVRNQNRNPLQRQNAVEPHEVGANGLPDPTQLAQRLLQERNERDLNSFRQFIRWLERAVALFIASLVPGVGERHIRARNEAAARLAAEREAEETRARETAEAGHSDEGGEAGSRPSEQTAAESSDGGELTTRTTGASKTVENQEDKRAQPPLIDI